MKNIYRKLIPALCLALLAAGGAAAAPAGGRAGAQRVSPLSDSLRPVRKAPSRQQRAAFNRFAAKHGYGWKVRYNPRTALPEAITGGKAAGYAGTPEQAAAAFFAGNKDLLKIDPSALELTHKISFGGVTHLQYQQYKDGLPVEFSYARVHVTDSGEVLGYQARFEPDITVNTAPLLSADAAVAAAAAHLGRAMRVSRTELVVYPDETDGTVKLAWKVRGRANGLWVYYIDANTGAVLFRYDDLRYYCNNNAVYDTYGTSSGTVYAISPMPTYVPGQNILSEAEDTWTLPERRPLRDQYLWVADYSSRTVTNAAGDFCVDKPGKVFSSLKGPYFSVNNFRNASAHYDNGGGQWRTYTHAVNSPHPYANSQTYDYTETIPNDWSPNNTFAKAMPVFSVFNVGDLDIGGSLNDPDLVHIKNGSSIEAVYMGNRTTAFTGAAIENPTYGITLKTSEFGTSNGFTVNKSSYLVLTNLPNVAASPALITWSTHSAGDSYYTPGLYMDKSIGGANALSEVNAFYHLNAIRRYFDPINKDADGSLPADLSRHVPVMVHAHGNADRMGQLCPSGDDSCGGMLNAYYDLENDNIMFGDGQVDNADKYHSFALDGTIVRHEYIHLVMHRIYPIINFGEFGALSEGLADYFALASFWRPDEQNNSYPSLRTLGNYVGLGEGSARDISGGGSPTPEMMMPDNWGGEVHSDSLMLSQALYKLRNPNNTFNAYGLGTMSNAVYAGQARADIFAFGALFYFPDNFANFKDAMLDACRQMEGLAVCNAAMQAKIESAFSHHGIGSDGDAADDFEQSAASAMCRSNNGPECASDIGNRSSLAATIYPLGDVDYYTLPVAPGNLTARLDLPSAGQADTYKAYSMLLFDADRNVAVAADGTEVIATPEIYNLITCFVDSGDCLTLSPSVTLNYTVPYGGRYYLVVSGALNDAYGNSDTNSLSPYTLTLDHKPAGSALASVYSAAYDGDEISFSVPYSRFAMNVSPSSSAVLDLSVTGTPEQSSAEFVFEYAQLRDHNYRPLEDTKTNVSPPASYLQRVAGSLSTGVDNVGRDVLTGRVRLQPGFAARYPGVGTIYLEVFGRNHLGHVVSLGVSNPINLAANRSGLTAYNNILTAPGDAAIIKYEVQGAGNLSVKVYTQSGSLVKTVFNGNVAAGKGTVDWDGTNSNGGKVASGIYFVKSKGPGLDKVVKVAVIR
jgi:Zn-dependent metalloprotease